MEAAVFEDDEGTDDPLRVTAKSWEKIKIAREKDGFAEGKYSGETKALQEGFNEGYSTGFSTHFNLAVLKGVIGAVETHIKSTSTTDQIQQISELKKNLKELELVCLKFKKNCSTANFSASDSQLLDSLTLEEPLAVLQNGSGSENDATESNTTAEQRCNHPVPSSQHIEEQFNVLKSKTLAFLNECGLSSMCNLIENIQNK